jgi:hypothetical protein
MGTCTGGMNLGTSRGERIMTHVGSMAGSMGDIWGERDLVTLNDADRDA